MTDHELEQRLRAWYQAEIPVEERAPTALRSSLRAIPGAGSLASRRGGSRGRGFTLLAAAATVALVAGTAAVGSRLLTPAPAPPASASWTAAGEMINDHVNHTATLLPDGTVLVAGAYESDGAPTSAELYDPSTGSWTATGDMAMGRAVHTATLLPDGKVLVAGGDDGGTRTATAELYDPSTGSWTATGDMNEARTGHTASLLPDGRVLVAGGASGSGNATAELYDPRGGTWTATGNMAEGRSYHVSTLLPDGTVLVAGGTESGSAELYDPRSGTWTAAGLMIQARADPTATLLPDGTVLVAGDGEGGNSAELYDPRTGTWTATGTMTHGRYGQFTVTVLLDGTVLAAGGLSGDRTLDNNREVTSAELYDPQSRTWTATASMGTARRTHTATLLADGSVLVAGGIGPDGAGHSAELYAPRGPAAEPSITPITGRIVYGTHRWTPAPGGG